MCYVKTIILNNIKLVGSYKINSTIKFATEIFIIQLNGLIICTLKTSYHKPISVVRKQQLTTS